MKLQEQIQTTKLIYENLTGKKSRQAKEETLSTIFASVHDIDAVEQNTQAPTENNRQELDNLYANQEQISTDLQEITDNQNSVIDDVQELHKQIGDIKASLRNIITAINDLTTEEKPQPEEPMPQITNRPIPATTTKAPIPPDKFKLEQ